MNTVPDFIPFPKLARLSRDIVITEKLDGTNAQVHITEFGDIIAGSRTRWITPAQDNFGFAAWVEENKADLLTLGPGSHFGEWWGRGIQRNYGKEDRTFSLFNTGRWSVERPACCSVVPELYSGEFTTDRVEAVLAELKEFGSFAAAGYRKPEGIVIFHTGNRVSFKKTIDNDEVPKGLVL